jgi:hypothetical protein
METKEYFIGDSNEDLFYEHLADISQKNFEKEKEPMLTQTQFELLRRVMSVVAISKKEYTNEELAFIDIGEYGKICLN